MFGVKGTVSSCFKQLPSNLNAILDLIQSSCGEMLLLAV